MLKNFDTLHNLSIKKYDNIIVGSGPAGLILAFELQKKNKNILLIESGALFFNDKEHTKSEGLNNGRFNYPILNSRLRYFGGTSNHWGGWCHRLDEYDLELWKIKFNENDLNNFYKKSANYLNIEQTNYFNKKDVLDLNTKNFKHTVFNFSPPTRFNEDYFSHILNSKNIDLIIDVELIDIKNTDSNDINLITLGEKNINFKELKFSGNIILAAGAIENYKLVRKIKKFSVPVYNSSSIFSDHFALDMGKVLVNKKLNYQISMNNNIKYMPRLILTKDFAQYNKLNFMISFEEISLSGIEKILAQNNNHVYRVLCVLSDPFNSSKIDYDIRANKVLISFSPNIEKIHEKVKSILTNFFKENTNILQYKATDNEYLQNYKDLSFGWHPMLTVPINIKNNEIFVNENLLLNKQKKIFVLGSSAFNNVSYANPTLTIGALAIKLAKFL